MRDIRNPIDLFDRIQHEKRVHDCGILEAADRVELHRNLSPAAQNSRSSPLVSQAVPPSEGEARPLGYADFGPAQNGPGEVP